MPAYRKLTHANLVNTIVFAQCDGRRGSGAYHLLGRGAGGLWAGGHKGRAQVVRLSVSGGWPVSSDDVSVQAGAREGAQGSQEGARWRRGRRGSPPGTPEGGGPGRKHTPIHLRGVSPPGRQA